SLRGDWSSDVCSSDLSRPSNDTETSSSSTNVMRLGLGSKPSSRPPPKPRCPAAPKRNQPSRPHVAQRTEKTSPRDVHGCAPNTRSEERRVGKEGRDQG